MWKIERDEIAGLMVFKFTFSGFIKKEEMQEWVDESKKELRTAPKEFGIYVDMRGLKPLPHDAQELMQVGQSLYREKGMLRSSVLVDKIVTKMQFERIGQETGIDKKERYFSAEEPDYEASMEKWLASPK